MWITTSLNILPEIQMAIIEYGVKETNAEGIPGCWIGASDLRAFPFTGNISAKFSIAESFLLIA